MTATEAGSHCQAVPGGAIGAVPCQLFDTLRTAGAISRRTELCQLPTFGFGSNADSIDPHSK